MPDTGGLPPQFLVQDLHDLAVFLGGDESSFTGHLLRLIAKADPGNRARLAGSFPREVAAWRIWQAADPQLEVRVLDVLIEAALSQGQREPCPTCHR